MSLDRDDPQSGFVELGSAAAAAGKVIDLCVHGGSCLMLVSDFRQASADVDAVAITDQAFIDRIARAIAAKRGWRDDWINDGVRTFLSPLVDAPEDHGLTGTYPTEVRPGLRVCVPTPEYMLAMKLMAMKLMAMRIDEATGGKDKDEFLNLMSVVGIATRVELIAAASADYPEARVSAKTAARSGRHRRRMSGKDTSWRSPAQLPWSRSRRPRRRVITPTAWRSQAFSIVST